MPRAPRERDPDTGNLRCTRCGEWKPSSEFHKNPRMLYGVNSDCKVCRRERSKAYMRDVKVRDALRVEETRILDLYGPPPD